MKIGDVVTWVWFAGDTARVRGEVKAIDDIGGLVEVGWADGSGAGLWVPAHDLRVLEH